MTKFLTFFIFLITIFSCSHTPSKNMSVTPSSIEEHDGIKFKCSSEQLIKIDQELLQYFNSLQINENWYNHKINRNELYFTLNTEKEDTNTLDLINRSQFKIREEVVELIKANKKDKTKAKSVLTVSKKEIAMALMQHGRTTEFSGANCSTEALIDHIGIRQNIAAWTEKVSWRWPDGSAAAWNKKYWKRGSPTTATPVHVIINDMFINEDKYSIGCYTATKMVVIQGVLDYYFRIKQDLSMVRKLEKILLSDNEPLVGIEPGIMWSFEKDFDLAETNKEGKLLDIQHEISPKNVIPGEWIYLLNTDSKSHEVTGYEGSNAISLGRNKLDDYYNDHNHSYTFEEKLDEVWQWRNEVFSRSRHASRIRPLTHDEILELYKSPQEGGLLFDYRVIPKIFTGLNKK
ncbi:MAG: hypothetical protein Q7U04_02580 [Bacteriovorax sp.]|nr:hypothetical protein [Bacteriovorax sp.]